jgi:DNA replication and repair protein RecF
MPLSNLNILNFRNLDSVCFNFDENCNIFYGKNGSGKTSILEAIHYLALGRSFRSHLLRRIIKYDQDGFSLFGKIQQDNNYIPVGIERSITKGKYIKIAGKEASSNLEIIKLLPFQLLNQNSFRLFDEGSKTRRQFIDWGLFHVEQNFITLWRQVERIIAQRNAALKTNIKHDYIKAWDKEFAKFSLELHKHREKYIENFILVTKNILQKLLGDLAINISYFAGWNTELDLEEILSSTLKNDIQCGYTTSGPQRADLKITINKIPAKDALSRGQQKLLLYGLQISQGILLKNLTQKNCVYLVDDLAAELDTHKLSLISEILLGLESQLFVTGLAPADLSCFNSRSNKMFHVEQGNIFIA